jgi:hypothetical protein
MISCLVRKKEVLATPEEKVRQACLNLLITKLNYPISSLSVEQYMPEVGRRLDILCYSQGIPLLLIECKAEKITEKAERQLIGYNHYIKAPFLALVGQEEARMGWYQEGWKWVQGLPDFKALSPSL